MALPADSDPSTVLREAKGLALDLKKSLKSTPPWDRAVELQRQRLRDHYVQLIFQDLRADMAQQHLWSETSHAIIDVYRARIQQIESAIGADRAELRGNLRRSAHGPVELRKVSQSFRTFLLQEEKFWRQFSLRLVSSYGLMEVLSILAQVGISEEPVLDDDVNQPDLNSSRAMVTDEKRIDKIDMLQRSIIYLGDLSRYRDLNEAQSNSKRTKGRNGIDSMERKISRDFTTSEAYYQAAIVLAPNNGTPFNQLAILATYQSNSFDALYYYYRAACTTQPFGTVSENLERLLSKAIQTYRRAQTDEESRPPMEDHTNAVDALKQDVVILHGLWARNSRSTSAKLCHSIENRFHSLIVERTLPPEVLVRLLLMDFAVLWRTENSKVSTREPSDGGAPVESSSSTWPILCHILDLISDLFTIAQDEVSQADVQASPVLRISAILRRVLPALRLASKWMCSRFASSEWDQPPSSDLAARLTIFWASYVAFLNVMSCSFPLSDLPKPNQILEEDFTPIGFLPMLARDAVPHISAPAAAAKYHPNEEHLIRIADLLWDGITLAQAEATPLTPSDLLFGSNDPSAKWTPKLDEKPKRTGVAYVAGQADPVVLSEKDDDVSTTTSDDPVNMAMRVGLGLSSLTDAEEEEEDVVLFPRAPVENHAVELSGPTAQDLLLQVLGLPEPATPKGTPRAVTAGVAVSVKSSPRVSQPAILFGPNIWSGPGFAPQQGVQQSAISLYGPYRSGPGGVDQTFGGTS
ncbi:hypothetical protein DACRYDRAFT_89295 [Dacryopinax primogenitus]|uniref:Protein SMG7 n=1 Tax=Dacryopinax primogenitus (strain DJM 731) TaxID=1858805 RepID=M5G0E3_DACPD|nr:uncharacterized protein DACRYDRAFT_89295 [Dacryopinax primogenitus]EJU01610.1 hypothetical protein DACRYDRAFT_89295 [Dacryopinax primogenitus]